MVRWEPGARSRLQSAALDLYLSQGFEQTTAAEIAQSVGLTERTFFRHFTDKREVLFDGQDVLVGAFLDGVAAAPDDASPLRMVTSALAASAGFFADDRREHSRRRQTVITGHPALRERELLKMAGLASSLADALRLRGVVEPVATLTAQSAVTVFGVAFVAWIAPGETRSMDEIEREVMRALSAVVQPGG